MPSTSRELKGLLQDAVEMPAKESGVRKSGLKDKLTRPTPEFLYQQAGAILLRQLFNEVIPAIPDGNTRSERNPLSYEVVHFNTIPGRKPSPLGPHAESTFLNVDPLFGEELNGVYAVHLVRQGTLPDDSVRILGQYPNAYKKEISWILDTRKRKNADKSPSIIVPSADVVKCIGCQTSLIDLGRFNTNEIKRVAEKRDADTLRMLFAIIVEPLERARSLRPDDSMAEEIGSGKFS